MTKDESTELIGQPVLDPEVHKVGKITQVLVDEETGEPEWAVVETGLINHHEYAAPLKDAAFDDDDVRIPILADEVKQSPEVHELSAEELAAAQHYYDK